MSENKALIELKNFKVYGEVKKGKFKMSFIKVVKALKIEDVLEKIYCDFGSRHKAKRFEIKILNINQHKD
ncbi:50S ribosomal protein L18a [Candidatus Bathyarchaeota archaeon]|nr:50S ribosomal protein L18a [Candidatus Bathyarchaeota archaeon]